jgi:hypothetical protein
MFLVVMCQHASGACQSHFRPVLSLREASRKYIELSPNTLPFLTLRFHKKDLTPTPNLLRIRPIPPPLGHILSATAVAAAFLLVAAMVMLVVAVLATGCLELTYLRNHLDMSGDKFRLV